MIRAASSLSATYREPASIDVLTRWRRFLQRLGLSGQIGLTITLLIALVALAGPSLAPYSPTAQNLPLRRASPTLEHPFGYDEFGRDILSRTMHGAQIAFLVGVSSVLFAGLIGIVLGAPAGYLRGKTDEVIMRIMDIALAFPYLLLALAIVGILGPGLQNTILAISISSIPGFARIVRGATLAAVENEYVHAAVCVGVRPLRIIIRHIGPNVLSPILVHAAISFANAVLMEASLSFLGLGVPPPTPSWGSMIASGRDVLRVTPHVVAYPALVLAVTVLGLNLLADGVRDALDPRLVGAGTKGGHAMH